MAVSVNLYPWLSEMAGGQRKAYVKGHTVGECLNEVNAMFPGISQRLLNREGQLRPYISILLNGEATYPEELSKPVKNGDEISIIFIIDGG